MKCGKTGRLWLAAVMLTCVVSLQAQQPVFVRVFDYQEPYLVEPNDTGVFSLAVGDLNRDGKQDIFASFANNITLSHPVDWIAQGGTPRDVFTLGMTTLGGSQASWKVFLGDWNNDGYNDAVVTRSSYVSTNIYGQYAALRSVGPNFDFTSAGWNEDAFITIGGPFNMPQPTNLHSDPTNRPDLITIRNKDGQVYLRLNDGTGHFPNDTSHTWFQGYFNYLGTDTNEIYPIAAGHLDATKPATQNDVVIARPSTGQLFIWFQHAPIVQKDGSTKYFNGDANYVTQPATFGGYGTHANDIHLRITHLGIGDFNGDGKNDIVVAREDGSLYNLFQGPGTPVPTFTNNVVMSYGRKLVDMKIGDVDGDGRADIVAARSDGVLSVLYQKAPGVFHYQVIDQWIADIYDANSGMITNVAIGDMDSDGIRDITVGLKDGSIYTYYGLCSNGLAGDLTGDCMVDFRDVKQFASQWLATTPGMPETHIEDLSGDGMVNFSDMATLAMDWMKCNLVLQSDCWH